MGDRRYAKNDQLAVVVCDEDRFLACVGVARPERFGLREQRALAGLIPALQQRLKLDLYMSNAPLLMAGLHASLDLIPGEACLVRATSTSLDVVEANTLARRAFNHERVAFLEQLKRSLVSPSPVAPFRVSQLKSSGAPNHFLLVRASPQASNDEARLALARVRWGLTKKQVAVLSRLAQGRANKTIANELGCAEVSVEFHVTSLLRRSGSSSRAELIAQFWSMPM